MNRISKAALAALVFASLALSGCGGGEKASGEKTVVYATTGYGREMGDAGLDPHENYSGWSTVRYGVGETLFRLSDAMTPEPWLAKHFEYVDDSTVDIELCEGISFSSGRKMDGEAVKECLEALVAKNPRAAFDLLRSTGSMPQKIQCAFIRRNPARVLFFIFAIPTQPSWI